MTQSARSHAGHAPVTVTWSSPAIFVLAAGGASIGYNNFWQFPAQIAKGGGAFLACYLAGVVLVALPLLTAQIALGRTARSSPGTAFDRLAAARGADPHWWLLGGLCLLSSFLVLSYLCVFAGWTLAYNVRALVGAFAGQTADGLASLFAGLVKDPEKQIFWFTLFVLGIFTISSRGVHRGLELFARFAMAWLSVLLAFLLAYSATTSAFPQALAQLLMPDLGRLSVVQLVSAVGQAFFSLLLGMGVMMMYGAYTPERVTSVRVALWIVAIDTGTGLVAALAISALLLSGNVEMASGPALVFQAVPLALDHLSLGTLVTPVFFVILLLVACLSALALAEPLVAWLMEDRGLPRPRAALLAAAGVWGGGVILMLSFNHWAFSFPFFESVKKFGVFDLVQSATSNLLLPLAGLLIALFAGWVMKPAWHRQALGLRTRRERRLWLWLLRLVIPVALVVLVFRLPEIFT